MTTAWIDGRFVDGESVDAPARPPADAASVRGLFETMRAEAGRIPLWPRHLARLARSAAALGIRCTPPPDLEPAACELLARTGHVDGVLRLVLEAPSPDPTAPDPTAPDPTAPDPTAPNPTAPNPSWAMTTRDRVALDRPVVLAPSRARRAAEGPPADHKTTSRAFYDRALREAAAAGADDALILGDPDEVLETAVGNLFCLVGDRLRTPPLDGRVLPGVARAVLVEALGARVEERRVTLGDLRRAGGVWVTNAVWGPRVARLVERGECTAGVLVDPAWSAELAAAFRSAF